MQATSLVETEAPSSSEPPGQRPPSSPKEARTIAQRGQMLVVFVMSIFVIVGLVGLVIDVSWYWTNTLRVQRAADAAALAGAVQLPSRPTTGKADARSQAEKNGYPSLTAACPIGPSTPLPAICAAQDATNRNQMNVTVSAPVGTFFMRVFGIGSITATRASKALYTLPVPMGSPENYYGVFGDVRNATMTNVPPPETDPVATTSLKVPTTSPGTAAWTVTPTSPSRTLVQAVATNETAAPIYYARSNTNGQSQQWSGFGLTSGAGSIPATGTVGNTTTSVAIVGLQVQIDDALVSAACTGLNPNSTIGVSLSWNGGSNWSSMVNTTTPWNPTLTYLPTSATTGDYTIGNANNTTPWGAHAWTRGDFTDTNFRVRLTANKGATCASGTYLYVDQLRVQVAYRVSRTFGAVTTTASYQLRGPGTACLNGAADCYVGTPAGNGQVLNPRGFWATMNTYGAANLNGDAYQPRYDNPTSVLAPTCPSGGNACYDPINYYNYAVKMPAGTSGGRIFIYDPVFCATQNSSGTGDRWFGGSNAVSTWYEVYTDPNNTPYDVSDDSLYTSSGTRFQSIAATDSTMGGPGNGTSECRQRSDIQYGDGRDYHNSWFLLASGLAGGTTYRVHTTQSGPVSQVNTNGEQSFAIFADTVEGRANASLLPQVYGLGAMQMFTPLSAAVSPSTFYLAQVPEFYAGKILEINLWDPGDTGDLRATLYIERPVSGGWADANFTYTAKTGTTGGANSACNSNSNANPSNNSVLTNVGGGSTGNFNGCWLTLTIPIPTNYAGDQDGWWRIRYVMSGSGTSNDVTTWTAAIKGNPVHLVVP